MKPPTVSIIVVAYNSAEYLAECLRSLRKVTYRPLELLVVDNNSRDDSVDLIRHATKNWPYDFKLIRHHQNLGYATANNQGVNQSVGSMVFILNPDTKVSPNFLQTLVGTLNDQKKVAACQPSVYLLKDPNRLNLTGKVTHYLGFDWLKDYLSERIPVTQEIASFSGSGVLLKKEIFIKTGGFDDHYFTYYEDSDLSWRLRLAGYSLVYEPRSVLYHDYKFIPNERTQTFKQKFYYAERNRLLTILKNYSLKSLLLISPMLVLLELAILVYTLVTGLFWQKLKSYADIVKNSDYLWRARSQTQQLRLVSDKQLTKLFVSQISFKLFAHPVLRIVLNPILAGYWKLIRIWL